MYGLSSFFIGEQGVGAELGPMMRAASLHLLFDEMLCGRVARLAREPEDLVTLVEAVTFCHTVLEGMVAFHRSALHHSSTRRRWARCPRRGELWHPRARDEHHHAAFRARFLRDMAGARTPGPGRRSSGLWWSEARRPTGAQGAVVRRRGELFGDTIEETRALAMKALGRRLKVTGLSPGP